MDLSKKNILVITDGSEGMVSQVLGLAQEISENINSFIEEIKKIKRSGLKGNFINSVFISSTMGFGLKLEI